jgi:hypothetical protein
MLIEDVACPVDKLADMMIDLVEMFTRWAGVTDRHCLSGVPGVGGKLRRKGLGRTRASDCYGRSSILHKRHISVSASHS